MPRHNYAERDRDVRVVSYVLLTRRPDVSLELFSDYWKDAHGPLAARGPGLYQYRQFHLRRNEGDLWPTIEEIKYTLVESDQIDGIAELTFLSKEEHQTFSDNARILQADEQNVFGRSVGYNTINGNSKTYVDGIENSAPNGALDITRMHVLVKKAQNVHVEDFRNYLDVSFASVVAASDYVLKFRLHLLEERDNSPAIVRAPNVDHNTPIERQYQAAFEIAFSDRFDMYRFFESKEYAATAAEQKKYFSQVNVFPEREVYVLVDNGTLTLAGQRSPTVAKTISRVGALNQLHDDVANLMTKGTFHSSY